MSRLHSYKNSNKRQRIYLPQELLHCQVSVHGHPRPLRPQPPVVYRRRGPNPKLLPPVNQPTDFSLASVRVVHLQTKELRRGKDGREMKKAIGLKD